MVKKTKDTSDLNADIQSIKEDVAKLTKTLGQLTKNKVDDVKTSAKDSVDQGKENLQSVETATRKKIQENPAHALGIATGVGFVIGFFLKKK